MGRIRFGLVAAGVALILLALLGVVAFVLYMRRTSQEVDRQWAAIRAAGDPVTLADLAPPPVPPEQNAATYLQQADADAKAIADAVEPLWQRGASSVLQLSPADQAIVRAAFAAHPGLMPLIEQAVACPDYALTLDLNPSEADGFPLILPNRDLQTTRQVTRAVSYHADLLIADGRRDEAVKASLLLLRLARHVDRNPTLIGCLIANAVRGVATESAAKALLSGPVSAETREALEAELAQFDLTAVYDRAIKSERVAVVATFRNTVGAKFGPLGSGYRNATELAFLQLFARCLQLGCTSSTPASLESEFGRGRSVYVTLIVPSLAAATNALLQVEARIRALRVLNALQRHASTAVSDTAASGTATNDTIASDTVPKLDALGLPAEAIIDPFNGQPLHVVKTAEGWLVYSVGMNGIDDGGRLDNPHTGDVRVGPSLLAPPPPAEPSDPRTDDEADAATEPTDATPAK